MTASAEGRGVGEPLRLLGLKEVADVLGTDKENVRAWIADGTLPCVRVGARGEPRVSPLMLEAWQRGLVTATIQTTIQRRPLPRAAGRPRQPLKAVS